MANQSESPVYRILKDGSTEPLPDRSHTLKELQTLVGGDLIEVVSLEDGTLMIVDEEGLFKTTPVRNNEASKLANRKIVGDVVIMPSSYLD